VSQLFVSIVVPFYNEEANAGPMLDEIVAALGGGQNRFECIAVDDGSSDATWERLQEAQSRHLDAAIQLIQLQRNFGQTAAMQAGIDAAAGEFIVTMDGDRQNDPADIPAMLAELQRRDLDLLVGWRQQRQDDLVSRKLPSRLANRLIGRATGIRLNDYGCSLKVYRAALIKQVRLYGEMHRFIPVWMAMATTPQRIGEMVVNHRPRTEGQSKYGISRTVKVIIDLLAVYFFLKYRAKPGHFFGLLGMGFAVIGGSMLGWLAWDKFILGENIGNRPLLLAGIVFTIGSLQLFTTGIIAEYLARIYHESSQRGSYVIRRHLRN
jgi:glycosyltransferase involved in cell wall biosynthesis